MSPTLLHYGLRRARIPRNTDVDSGKEVEGISRIRVPLDASGMLVIPRISCDRHRSRLCTGAVSFA